MTFDIAFVGHYTKDTIVSPLGTRTVDGGAINYGANVAAHISYKLSSIHHRNSLRNKKSCLKHSNNLQNVACLVSISF